MEVKRPIFIVGTGRCGSTIFNRVLSEHPDAGWMTPICHFLPAVPALNRAAMWLLDVPVVGRIERMLLETRECYPYWQRHYRGFAAPCRDLVAADVTERARGALRDALGEILTGRKHRLLACVTGWPRVGFLREVFPDARFVHIVRDGRAVACSLLHVPWWRGWQGPEQWRWGQLSAEDRQTWEASGRSFVVLAGLQWKLLTDAMERARQSVPEDCFTEIRYEDLCRNPMAVLDQVQQFCDLPPTPDVIAAAKRYGLSSRNSKWKSELTQDQQSALESAIREPLTRYGYLKP